MKLTRIVLAAVLCCSLFAVNATAQSLQQPNTFSQTRLTYNYYQQEAAPSPSDVEAPAADKDYLEDYAKDDYGKDYGKGCGGDSKCGYCGGCDCCGLFPEMYGWQLEGFAAAGATSNTSDPANRFNGPMTFNDREDVVLNQMYLTLGREADTGGSGFAWGGRVDLMYGTDYIFTQAIGLETQPNGDNDWNGLTTGLGNPNLYGLAMPQAYVDVAYNNLSFRLGHFYTIMGYEVVPATGNFFYSHAYTMQYGEPFTHTGGLLTWSGDRLTAHAGLVNGWDKFDAVSDKLAFLGGLTYTPYHERYSLTATLISGEEDGTAPNPVPPATVPVTLYSLVGTVHITDRLDYVIQHDNGVATDFFRNPNQDAEWYGINQYLFYTLNHSWKVGARFEWFRDDDGVRLSNTYVRNGGLGLNPAGFAGNYYNITFGANWSPNCNIIVRPEVRWDWSDGNGVAPFADLTKDSQFTASFDAIIKF